jgi:hypothetical protein
MENKTQHWNRQHAVVTPKRVTPLCYQVAKLPAAPGERPLILAMTSKVSAQRLVASLAEQDPVGATRYRVTCFEHKYLPGLER